MIHTSNGRFTHKIPLNPHIKMDDLHIIHGGFPGISWRFFGAISWDFFIMDSRGVEKWIGRHGKRLGGHHGLFSMTGSFW